MGSLKIAKSFVNCCILRFCVKTKWKWTKMTKYLDVIALCGIERSVSQGIRHQRKQTYLFWLRQFVTILISFREIRCFPPSMSWKLALTMKHSWVSMQQEKMNRRNNVNWHCWQLLQRYSCRLLNVLRYEERFKYFEVLTPLKWLLSWMHKSFLGCCEAQECGANRCLEELSSGTAVRKGRDSVIQKWCVMQLLSGILWGDSWCGKSRDEKSERKEIDRGRILIYCDGREKIVEDDPCEGDCRNALEETCCVRWRWELAEGVGCLENETVCDIDSCLIIDSHPGTAMQVRFKTNIDPAQKCLCLALE